MDKRVIFFLLIAFLAGVFIFGVLGWWFLKARSQDDVVEPVPAVDNGSDEIDSFEDCVNAGFPVMESYPRQCMTDDGKTYVEDLDEVIDSAQGGSAGLANPASVYCEDTGGELEMREEEGGTAGYCIFEDGSECEEWDYFTGECEKGESLE